MELDALLQPAGHFAGIQSDTAPGLTTMILGALVVALTLGSSLAAPRSKIFCIFKDFFEHSRLK